MTSTMTSPPTVALVHGAFADSSGWTGVIRNLQAQGIQTRAISNPLRGISEDAAYVASALRQIPGPVLAVAHSYGGAVITNAATKAPNVRGLVYVAAFAPDEGETLMNIEANSKDSVLNSVLVEREYPTANGTQKEYTIDPSSFASAFAADVPPADAAVMGASQRAISALCFVEPTGPPAWRTLPTWAAVATGDKAAGSDVVRSMAQRAGATTTEIDGSHVIMVSRPDAVSEVVMEAIAGITD